jgi:hypothetical protein
MELKPMKTEVTEAIKTLTKKAAEAPAHEALHLSQAALNLAHVVATLAGVEHLEKRAK